LLSTESEQLDLLTVVLKTMEEAPEVEAELNQGEDDLEAAKNRPKTKRNVGSLAAWSGSAGLRYLEFSTIGGGGRGGGGRGDRGRPRGGGGGYAGKLAKFRR
jgi:hypothetical protein